MKNLLILTPFLLFILATVSSCKTYEGSRHTEANTTGFYRKINKQLAIENHLIESIGNNTGRSISQQMQSTESTERSSKYSAERSYMAQERSNSDPFKVVYDDSEFANGEVYIQAAKRRQTLMENVKKGCKNCTSDTIKKTTSK